MKAVFKTKGEWRSEFATLSDKAVADKLEVAKASVVQWNKELGDAVENAGGLMSSLFGSVSAEDQMRIDNAKLTLKGWKGVRDAAKEELAARAARRPKDVKVAKEEAVAEAADRAQEHYEDRKNIDETVQGPVEESATGFLATIARGPTAIASWVGLGGGEQSWEDRLSGLLRLAAIAALVIGGAYALQSILGTAFGAAGGTANFIADQSGKNFERVASVATKIPGGTKW